CALWDAPRLMRKTGLPPSLSFAACWPSSRPTKAPARSSSGRSPIETHRVKESKPATIGGADRRAGALLQRHDPVCFAAGEDLADAAGPLDLDAIISGSSVQAEVHARIVLRQEARARLYFPREPPAAHVEVDPGPHRIAVACGPHTLHEEPGLLAPVVFEQA